MTVDAGTAEGMTSRHAVRDGAVPDGWRRVRLGDVAKVGTGNSAPQGNRYFEGGIFPFVRTQDVGLKGVCRALAQSIDKVNATAVKNYRLQLWPAGTILVPKSGASTLLNHRAMLARPAYVSSHLATVVARDSVDRGFLFYALCRVDAATLIGNDGYPSLRASDLSKALLLLPPLPEQRKIAEILSAVDDAIERTEAVIDQVRRVKQGLAQQLLTRGLPGRHTHYKQTEVGEIPACWEVVKLGDVVRLNPEMLSDRTPPDYEFQYIDISTVTEPGVIAETRTMSFAEAPSRARRVVRTGDVLVSTVRPYLRAFALVRSGPPNLVCSTGFAVLRPLERLNPEFVYQTVLTDRFVEFLNARMAGSNYPAVMVSDVADFPLPRPPIEEQNAIAELLRACDLRVEGERASLESLRSLKSGLMHALLTGRVRVRVEAEAAGG